MSTATAPKSNRSLAKRTHIYRVAMSLFKRQGFRQTTIRDICREADISNGTFYHFFGDKSGVVLEFFREVQHKRETYLTPTPENLAKPFQSVYQYFIHVAAMQDYIGQDFSRDTMYTDPNVLAAKHMNTSQQSCLVQVSRLLQAAADIGTVPSDLQAWSTAEFLMTAASGTIFNWITLAENESAVNAMRRMLPQYIAAVSDETLDVHWEPQL